MTIAIPPGERVYAIGDVHGLSATLDALLDAIEADLRDHPAERVTEVFIGDYVDRGPDSFGVIERLLRDPPAGRTRVYLMGNHEHAMLAGLRDGEAMSRWLGFGGEATATSYGVDPAEHNGDALAIQARLHAAIPERHLAFLTNLTLQFQLGRTLFVHAGIRPEVPLNQQDPHDLMWIRDAFLDYDGPLEAHVVHGHTPAEEPEDFAWRTNVDTGAVYGGQLTAAVLEGSSVRFIQVPADG